MVESPFKEYIKNLLIHTRNHNVTRHGWQQPLVQPENWHLSPLSLLQVTLSAQVSSSVRREWWRTPAPWAWPWSSGSSRASSPPSGRCATPSWASPSPSRGETTPTSRTSSAGWQGERARNRHSVGNNQGGRSGVLSHGICRCDLSHWPPYIKAWKVHFKKGGFTQCVSYAGNYGFVVCWTVGGEKKFQSGDSSFAVSLKDYLKFGSETLRIQINAFVFKI